MSERSEQTSDPAVVEEWADRRGLVPARRTDADELVLVDEGVVESDDATDRLGWDEFAAEFDRRDATFRFPEGGAGPTEADDDDGGGAEADADAGEADEPDGSDDGPVTRLAEADEALEEGESARAEVRETRTVEEEVVTTATVETEVVDGEITSEEVVDVELLDRELDGCTVDEDGEYVEADLRERKLYTTEVRRRDLVESRVVDADADVSGADAASDTAVVDREVDVEGDSAVVDDAAVEREMEETRVRDRERAGAASDAVEDETELDERVERRIVETEVVTRDRVRARITERDRIEEEVTSEAITGTELLDATEEDDGDDTGAETESEREATHDPTDETVWVDDSHEGDPVVDADGETVGRIARVDGLTIWVDVDGGGEASLRQDQVEDVGEEGVRVSGLGGD